MTDSKKVTRFSAEYDSRIGELRRDPAGDYVLFDDYENLQEEMKMQTNELLKTLDRDARTLYDLATLRAQRDDATKEDIECKEIALRLWQNLDEVHDLLNTLKENE